MTKLSSSVFAVFFAAVLALSSVSADDELIPGESILDRQRPELDPLGMRFGAFFLYPKLDVQAEHQSNIFAQSRDEIDDVIIKVSPAIALESNWVRHSLKLEAAGTSAEYQENVAEDFDDYAITADARFDVYRASRLRLKGSFKQAHEERDSVDDVKGLEPTLYDESEFSAVLARRVGKITLRAGGLQRSVDFDDARSLDGVINNDDRDRKLTRYSLRTGYQVRPDINAFLHAEVDQRDYENKPDDDGVNRDSKESKLAIGMEGALAGSTYAEVLAGYSEREYQDTQLETENSPWFQGRLMWSPSGLTTLTLSALKEFDETSLEDAKETISTQVGLRIDHELRRNLLLYFDSFVRTEDFSGIDRSDDTFEISLGARYLVHRSVQLAIQARHRDRESTTNDRENIIFKNTSIMLSIRAQR